MITSKLGSMPSLRRQNLLAEFAGLKQSCPEGIFVSLTPGDPTLWSGVIFVRKGPYATAILRFQISFPDTYPRLPPLVTFSTDIFHPLITPLNTYTYTTDIQNNGTVSATDEERLPPGGFSLRHGFPSWFGRGSRSLSSSRQASGQQTSAQTPPRAAKGPLSNVTTPDSKATPPGAPPSYLQTTRGEVSTYEVLRYIRSTFDDEDLLDSVPLEAAGNPSAWHAWRSHQRQMGKTLRSPTDNAWHDGLGDGEQKRSKDEATNAATTRPTPAVTTRQPGEWNWEGVWEDRVKKGIAASLSEPVLYGGAGPADDLIRFLPMEDNDVDVVKDNLLRTLGNTT